MTMPWTWWVSTWSPGVIGILLTGVFASLAVNAAGVDARLAPFGRQFALAAVAIVYPFVITVDILWLVDRLVGLRVNPDEQALGLDLAEYGEMGYALDLLAGSRVNVEGEGSGVHHSHHADIAYRDGQVSR
jgi:Ammonium Transporter Family